MLKMKVLGSVVFFLFYMVLVRKQGPQKRKKKTIEKPEEKQTQNIASAPIDTQCYMNRKYPWEPRYSTNPISTIPFYI